MTKEQFISLLRNPATINLNMVKGLEEITERFPYFQNAHLLLAKQYQGHQNIRYESYLRKAAAYAPDRKVLYDLIQLEPDKIIHINEKSPELARKSVKEPVTETHVEVNVMNTGEIADVIIQPEIQEPSTANTEESEKVSEYFEEKDLTEVTDTDINNFDSPATIPSEEKINEKELHQVDETVEVSEENASAASEAVIEEDIPAETNFNPDSTLKIESAKETIPGDQIIEKSTGITKPEPGPTPDPQEILAKRLKELAQQKAEPEIAREEEEQEPEIPDWPVKIDEVYETKPDASASEINKPVIKDDEEPEFIRVKGEPREPKEISEPRIRVQEHHTFLDWLKIKDIPVIPTEKFSEYFGKETEGDLTLDSEGNDLIDQFIKTEPRIVPARSEFYSPGNMARQSAIDHEDLISETLARIYAQQGNIPKAIDAYKRLSLKNPEKSSYFAALIKELEEQNPS